MDYFNISDSYALSVFFLLKTSANRQTTEELKSAIIHQDMFWGLKTFWNAY